MVITRTVEPGDDIEASIIRTTSGKIAASDEEKEDEKEDEAYNNSNEIGLRRRQVRKQEDENESEWVQDGSKDDTDKGEYEMNEKRPVKSSTKNKKKKKPIRDPLHWFGLLVSPSLRTSQHHFKTGKSTTYAVRLRFFLKIVCSESSTDRSNQSTARTVNARKALP